MKKRGWVLALLAWSLTAAFAVAQSKDPKVQLSAGAEPASLRVGEATTLHVDAVVPAGYHMYGMTKVPAGPRPLTIKLTGDMASALESVGVWHAPKPKVEFDPNFKKKVEYYDGKVRHAAGYRVKAGAKSGDVKLAVRGQFCNESRCIPFKEVLSWALTVESGAARTDRTSASKLDGVAFTADRKPAVSVGPASGAKASTAAGLPTDLWNYILVALLAGFAALLTPCVFPMIPITVSFFTKFSDVSLRRSAIMAGVYAISIIGTFTLLGMVVSVVFGAVGMQAISSSPWFNLFLMALLFVFAFNLFGLFEIRVPSFLVNRASAKEQELASGDEEKLSKQLAGVFFMALTFTLVSFTCTVAFIGIVLAEAAKGQWFYPTVGMLAFSTSFSIPFFLLAMFPSWATKLRGKGGDWMVAIKVVLGFLEFAAGFKFLSNVDLIWGWGIVTRPLVLTVWAAVFASAAFYLLRMFRLPHDDEGSPATSPLRMAAAFLFLGVAIYATTGIRDTKSMGGWMDAWLPPAVYPGEEVAHSGDSGASGHLSWIVDDIDKGMRVARDENKALFLDFTGYTCTNCRFMEGNVFPKPQVRSRLEQMVRVTAYTDGSKPVHDQQRAMQIKRFDTAALPFYVVINPFDDTVLASFADMTKSTMTYVAFLDKGLAAFADARPKVAAAAPTASAEAKPAGPPVELAAEGEEVDLEYGLLLKDGKFKLSSLRGKWVLLNFWASWCSPCKKELREDFPPALKSAPHVELVTVAFDEEDSKDAAVAFAKELKLDTKRTLLAGTALDEAKLAKPFALGENANLPITYLIHPKGHIAWMTKKAIHRAELERVLAATK